MEISAERLYKKFRDHWIIRDFSQNFQKDVRYGIAGPNGTGKTTLLQILAGLIPPSKGRLEYREGGDLLSDELWYRQIVFAAPYADLYEYMDLNELIRHHLAFKTLAGGLSAESFIDRCYLKGHESKLIRSYSSGMKQRLKLGLALLSESPVLFLDEPQSNLDDRAKSWYQELLRERAPGRIVLIASNEADDFKMVDEVISLAAPSR